MALYQGSFQEMDTLRAMAAAVNVPAQLVATDVGFFLEVSPRTPEDVAADIIHIDCEGR